MKIAFDVSYVQKKRAGIGRFGLELIKTLLDCDYDNEYVLHGWSFGIDSKTLSGLERRNTRLSASRIPGGVKRLYWNRMRFPPIETFVGAVDIFHSTDPLLPPTRKAKTVCHVYDLAYKRFPAMFERRVLEWDAFVQASINRADAIIVPSNQTKNDLVELFDVSTEQIHMVQLPVSELFTANKQSTEDERIKQKYRLNKPYVLSVGTIEPRKNIPRIVEGFAAARQESKTDLDLVLIGKKGWLYDASFQAINSSSAHSSIRYLDYVSDEDLASLYRHALCFVYPSLYEGYGFPVLEAMASGVPIITSNNSSLREIADGVALLIDPLNVNDIADAMVLLIKDDVRRVEMRSRGRQVVQRFTSEAAAQKVLALYQSLGS